MASNFSLGQYTVVSNSLSPTMFNCSSVIIQQISIMTSSPNTSSPVISQSIQTSGRLGNDGVDERKAWNDASLDEGGALEVELPTAGGVGSSGWSFGLVGDEDDILEM